MRRLLRWLGPAVLAVGAVAGGVVAWRSEAAAASGSGEDAAAAGSLVTPVLSVRRLPTVVAEPIAARRLAADLRAAVADLPPSTCLAVSGPDLTFGHRADEPMIPASTQKLLTATAALEVLDPDLRFRTTVVAAGEPAGGVVPGDLTLVGGGDPLLATADYASRFRRQPQLLTDLDELAAAVHEAGVRRIEGSVVGDERRYDTTRYVAGWPRRYIDNETIGPMSALAVNDGFARYPTSTDRDVPLEPAAQPAVDAAAVLTRLLEARGVDVVGAPGAGAAPEDGVEVAAIESAPLPEVVGQLLEESDNATAELLLKELGRASGRASTAGGAAVVLDVVEDVGAPVVADGSGLSLDDRVTCQLLVDLLDRPDTGDAIVDRLPRAGESGTLAERFQGTPLEGVLRAKTGTLSTVAGLAGVVEDDDPPLSFALLVNTVAPVPASVSGLQQRVAEALASWPRVPDVTVLGPQAPEG